jgi:indolepyruvate ferredoxin oxidoreductase beta subunit
VNRLEKDPINLIISGVGGQGTVLVSRLIGQALLEDVYQVTIGETYGASQRGGSVASHVRISKNAQYSPITPEGKADIILGLEPVESLRILGLYGSPKTFVITNTRPIYPMAVATGETEYPRLENVKQGISELAQKAWYIDASELAIKLGAPLLTNMVMVGALISTGLLPLKREMFERQLEVSFQGERLTLNLKAFTMGLAKNS